VARIRQQKTTPRISWVSKTIPCGNGDVNQAPGGLRYIFVRPLSVNSAAENGAFFFWLR
jgi:hypothetical protein